MLAATPWMLLLLLLSLCLAALREIRQCSEEAEETLGALGLLEPMHGSTGPTDIAHNIISERQGPYPWVLWTHLSRLSIYMQSPGSATQGTYSVKE